MHVSLRSLTGLIGAAALTLGLTAPATAGEFTGHDLFTATLYDIDTTTNVATNAGVIANYPPNGLLIARSPTDGTLYGLEPGLLSGYTIYSIDEDTDTVTQLWQVGGTNISGNVGMTVDPSGNSLWVAGFVGFSFNVKVQEVDLATGVMTERGITGGNMAGLAFDGAGDLFTVIIDNGGLIKIDQIDAAISSFVANISGADLTSGLGLASDLGSGSMHIFSRATSQIWAIDSMTANGTLVSSPSGASSIWFITENLPEPTADDFVGLDQVTGDLYRLNSGADTSTLLGPITGGPAFGFYAIDRAPNGKLYATAPGLFQGYSVYEIDEGSLTASLVAGPISTNISGNVGIAVDPSGNSVWVAGFVGFSLNVGVEQVDLNTGLMTPHGQTGGNMWGLAFDASGDLFTSLQGATDAELVKIDKIDAAISALVGPMTGVDYSFGLDLASDVNSGSVHVYSRALDSIYSVDTSTGAATAVGGTITGASTVFSFAEVGEVCTLVAEYGAGCVGAGGFTPSLVFTGCPAPSAPVSVEISGGVGGAMAALLFGIGQGSTPVGGGCDLLLSGASPVSILLPLGGSGNGNGSVTLPATLPASLPSGAFTMQAFCADVTTGIGFTTTNGVMVTLP